MFIRFSGFIPFLLLLAGIVLLACKKKLLLGKILLSLGYAVITVFLTFFMILLLCFQSVHATFYGIMVSIFVLLFSALLMGFIWGFGRRKKVYISFLSMLCVCGLVTGVFFLYASYVDNIPKVSDSGQLLRQYAPYAQNSKVAVLEQEATLRIEKDLPKMDGATALYPVYAAFAKAIYPEAAFARVYDETGETVLDCTTTTRAYERIVEGDVDIIFVGAPSQEQEAYAKENGVALTYTPFGREAFVFFVNRQNPLENISLQEIRDIYAGRTTKWEALGVRGFGEIKAFQRDAGSGSQTAIRKLMGKDTLMEPIRENVINGMGGIIEKTADYKNYKNAIGYTFRFYAQEMVQNDQIKFLKIDGIMPNLANIENGAYPLTSQFYAVTRQDASENTKKIIDWIVSDEAQTLVEKTGYTPIR